MAGSIEAACPNPRAAAVPSAKNLVHFFFGHANSDLANKQSHLKLFVNFGRNIAR
jgi:hypothetical protein